MDISKLIIGSRVAWEQGVNFLTGKIISIGHNHILNKQYFNIEWDNKQANNGYFPEKLISIKDV